MPRPTLHRHSPKPVNHAAARARSRGQSLVELAITLPVLLLIALIAIDFGRVYLGWINVQQMTRVAAGYASEHASAWVAPFDAASQAKYRQKVANDARQINCQLPNPIPDPVFSAGTALGAPVRVGLNCQFSLITPIISNIVGGTLIVSAETVYPIREGAVAVVPGGGVPVIPVPVADFVGIPRSGWAPLTVQFSDRSTGGPTGWNWDFNTGTGGAGSPSVSPGTALSKGPHSVTYDCAGSPGDTCTFGVSLAVSNAGGSDSVNRSGYITVTVPPASGPIAAFTTTPSSGIAPLSVSFAFDDLRGGAVSYSSYEWDFTGDGSYDATGITVNHSYSSPGVYDVWLRVTEAGTNVTNVLRKVGAVVVDRRVCTVPNFANVRRNSAQALWSGAGFSTNVQFLAGNGNYSIQFQSLVGGTLDPQPNGCASSITVGP